MADIEIRLDKDKPELSLNDNDIFLEGEPLLVFNYSGIRLSLSKSAILNLKLALKQGDGMLHNYRLFMEAEKTLPLPFP
jgi:hypothetical protein